jgi:hypothetical protein
MFSDVKEIRVVNLQTWSRHLRPVQISYIYIPIKTAPVVYWSEFLATDPEVPGSIPGANRFSEK